MVRRFIVPLAAITLVMSSSGFNQAQAQCPTLGGAPTGLTVIPVIPPRLAPTGTNHFGWSTGYSTITTISERPNVLWHDLGGRNTTQESTTRIVPNDLLGNPIRYGNIFETQPNSAGWYTGYSVVTSTLESPIPFGRMLGDHRTVTETTTRIFPNDATGQPMRPFNSLWP